MRTSNTAAESTFEHARSRQEVSVRTEKRMRDGKLLILIGFIVAVLGIVAYCIVGLSAPARVGAVSGLGDWVGPSLGVIGVGTAIWLIGSVMFLRGAMDSDADTTGLEL